MVDGQNIANMGLRRLRKSIGLVPQTPFLFEVCIYSHSETLPLLQYTSRPCLFYNLDFKVRQDGGQASTSK